MLGLRLWRRLLLWRCTLANTEVKTFALDVLLVVGGGIRQASTRVIVAARHTEPLVTMLILKVTGRRLRRHLAALR